MISKPKGLAALSACDLVKMTRTRQVSCVEVVEACLARADDINPTINAFCTITADRALDAARTADASVTTSAKMGPLYGIPVALKDLTPTAGVRTTFGSKLYAHNVPSQDALLVQRIVAAGGIILGKTNTPEFGHKGITDNLVFGPTRNPWNTELTAGGSSGGSAAAVVANIVPIAEGSDGAGSIRIPASLCGAFGFKPTYGRIPDVAGAFSSHSPFFHNGPITRTVSDAALFYEAVAGADISDPFSIPYDESAVATLNDGIKGLKIAYSEDLGYFEVCPQVRDAMRRAVDVFESLGCQVEPVKLPFDQRVEDCFMTLWHGRMVSRFADLAPEELDLLEPKVVELVDAGRRLSALDYCRANTVRERVWNDLLAVHRSFDLLICPTTAVPAFPLAAGAPSQINGRAINPLIGWFLTYPFNLTGSPAASLPCMTPGHDLPAGIQVIGAHRSDALVLRACRAFEQKAPWAMVGAA